MELQSVSSCGTLFFKKTSKKKKKTQEHFNIHLVSCQYRVSHELKLYLGMLSSVKMESHEIPEWNAFYSEASEVSSRKSPVCFYLDNKVHMLLDR